MLHDKREKKNHSNTSSSCIKGPIMSGSGGGSWESSAIKDLHRDKVRRTLKQHIPGALYLFNTPQHPSRDNSNSCVVAARKAPKI